MTAKPFVALLAILAACSLGAASPPRVISALPDHAEIGVDPGIEHLRIAFDQDMNPSGRSICGGGPTFPKIDGEITWIDSRTMLIPVRLEPGRTYSLSINCPAARNFANLKGELAEPYPLSFATRKADEPAPTLTRAEARASATALRKAIDEQYSYRDLRKVDWNAVFAANADAMESAKSPSEFARAAARLLGAAKDMHITVKVGEFTLPTHRPGVRPNGDFQSLSGAVKGWHALGTHAYGGTYAGCLYILISDWSGAAKDYEPLFVFLEKNKDVATLIIDARFNSGGDELIARTFAGCFITTPTVYSRNRTRDPAARDGWTGTFDRIVKPSSDHPHFNGRVAVIMGKFCMSSNESFLLMMRHGANAPLIGEPSYGSSGNPRPVELGRGISVVLPSWIDMEPDGRAIEGIGVIPTNPVAWKPSPAPDPLLAEAVRLLQVK